MFLSENNEVCTIKIGFNDNTFLDAKSTISIIFNNPLFYAQYINFTIETLNTGNHIDHIYNELILNSIGNSVCSSVITPYNFLGQPNSNILRGEVTIQ